MSDIISTVKNNSLFGSANIYLCDSFDVSKLEEEITSKLIESNLLILSDDGVSFEEEKKVHSTTIAGQNEKRVKGLESIVSSEGKISGTGRLVNNKLLEASLYKKDSNTSTKYDVYSIKEGSIESNQYKDVVMVGINKSQEKAQMIVLKNAYNANLSLETKGSEDGSCKVEFVSAYDYFNLNQVPYNIITLKEIQE